MANDESLENALARAIEALTDLQEALTCLKDRISEIGEHEVTTPSSLTDRDIERIREAVRPPWPPYQILKIDGGLDDPFTRPTVID